MRIETFAPELDWSAVQARARAAEAAGFDSLCVPEICGDPFLALGAAAGATERINLRTAIALAFPRSPMVVAGSAWALQVNSKGRMTLGLGTQVKGHNERRFSVPWIAPRTRLKEYVEALRAVWRCWELGERLNYQGEHYQLTLMTPEFSPPKSGLPMVPVYLAAVRPRMLELAGSVADGVRLHGFCTRRYLEETALPALNAGLEAAGRDRTSFEVCGGGFIATGPTDEAVAKRLEWVRYRVAFYGSTRTYQPVMSLHGWDDLAAKLHSMSKQGKWKEMAAQVPDDVVREFAVVARYDQLVEGVRARFGGLSDTIEIATDSADVPSELGDVLKDLRELPARYVKQADHYA